jgi:predicted TIM-barrel fold metal-dependent hydrolase
MADYRIIDADGHVMELDEQLKEQLVSMIFEGVFELFPKLRFGCLECGVGWVPYMMDRMDEEQERDQRDFNQDIPTLLQRDDIGDALKRKIFFDNALGFYPRLRERLDKTASLARAAAG